MHRLLLASWARPALFVANLLSIVVIVGAGSSSLATARYLPVAERVVAAPLAALAAPGCLKCRPAPDAGAGLSLARIGGTQRGLPLYRRLRAGAALSLDDRGWKAAPTPNRAATPTNFLGRGPCTSDRL